MLVANGADVLSAGQYGQTPLHWAASNGDLDSAKLLLDRGANINAMNADSETPLDDADSALVADFLLAHGAHIGGFSDDATPLSSVDRDLFTAAVTGNVERIRSAVSHGAHVNIRDRNHGTPLIRAALLGRVDAAAALLNNGADIEEAKWDRKTPLHLAVSQGHLKLVELLLAHHANLTAKDTWHRTPLGVVRDTEIAKVLLRAEQVRAPLSIFSAAFQQRTMSNSSNCCFRTERTLTRRQDVSQTQLLY